MPEPSPGRPARAQSQPTCRWIAQATTRRLPHWTFPGTSAEPLPWPRGAMRIVARCQDGRMLQGGRHNPHNVSKIPERRVSHIQTCQAPGVAEASLARQWRRLDEVEAEIGAGRPEAG
jgi:hypothetical protein